MTMNTPGKRKQAEIVRRIDVAEGGPIHGVTFDGERVWFARDHELVAIDPETGRVVHRHALESARGGTAFDGTHLYQLSRGEILVIEPETGKVVRTMPSPGKGLDSGLAWADGSLFLGQWSGKVIHKLDARTGEIQKTLSTDRFVTGVSCVDGALWHGAAGDGEPTELRRLAPDGTVEETLEVPAERIAGVERTKDGTFWCAGDDGTLLLVRAS
jgi:outer membrane protein assembly factor BamB